jgi:hypothetical protein
MPSKQAVRFRGGYPLLSRVLKTDPEGAWSLRRAIAEFAIVAANDNHAQASEYAGDDDFEPAGQETVEFRGERRHQMKPSVNVMLADALRVVRHADGTMFRHAGLSDAKVIGRDTFRLADMIFSTSELVRRPEAGGLMLNFGWTRKGKRAEPEIDTRDSKGGHSGSSRSLTHITAYLKMPGAVKSPLRADSYRTPVSDKRIIPDMLDPLPQVVEARAMLADAIANTRSMPAVTKLPDGIAKGARFFGGISFGKDDARHPIDVWENGNDAQHQLSDRAREIVDEIAARGNLKSLGIRLGYSADYADRAAKAALKDAVAEAKRIFPPPPRVRAVARGSLIVITCSEIARACSASSSS